VKLCVKCLKGFTFRGTWSCGAVLSQKGKGTASLVVFCDVGRTLHIYLALLSRYPRVEFHVGTFCASLLDVAASQALTSLTSHLIHIYISFIHVRKSCIVIILQFLVTPATNRRALRRCMIESCVVGHELARSLLNQCMAFVYSINTDNIMMCIYKI
jgi:hypothetical protein